MCNELKPLYKLINLHDLSEFCKSIYLRDIQNTKVKSLKLQNVELYCLSFFYFPHNLLGLECVLLSISVVKIWNGETKAKMSFSISGEDAYQIYLNLDLRKGKKKSASHENVELILNKKGVQIKPKPSDKVSFNSLTRALRIISC